MLSTYTKVDSFKLAVAMLFSLSLLTLGISIPSFVVAVVAAFAVLGLISRVASGLLVFTPTFPAWAKAKLVVAKSPNKIMCFFIS